MEKWLENLNDKDQKLWNVFGRMKPMKYWHTKDKAREDRLLKSKDYIGMIKYDGEWCRSLILSDRVIMQSRSVSKVTGEYGYKTELVPHIAAELLENWPAGTVLIGELCFSDLATKSSDVGSILRCKPAKAIERQKDKKLEYRLFDCIAYEYENLVDKKFEERINNKYLAKCKEIELEISDYGSEYDYIFPDYVKPVGFMQIEDDKTAFDFDGKVTHEVPSFTETAKDVWSKGGEGIMLVHKDAPYRPGKRKAEESLKIKRSLGELELKVIDMLEPKREYEGKELDTWEYWEAVHKKSNLPCSVDRATAFGESCYDPEPVTKPYYYEWKNGVVVEYKGVQVKISSGLTDADREWLATEDAAKLVNDGELHAVVTGMEITEDGSIRHPQLVRLRDDV